MKVKVYLGAYAPSSPHRVIDLAKTAYSFNFIEGFIVIKPAGLAAQTGVPEAFKLAYRQSKPFFVLPSLKDLKEVLGIELLVFILQSRKEGPDLTDVLKNATANSIAIIVQAGETPIPKEEMALGAPAKINEMNPNFSPNPVAEATAALLKLVSFLDQQETH